MGILKKILKPQYLLVLLVLAGGTLFTVLQATSDQCVSTANGDLTNQSTFGEYNGISQSTQCGTDFNLDYIIGSGTTVSWDGTNGPMEGGMEINSGGTLRIEGDVAFNFAKPSRESSRDYRTDERLLQQDLKDGLVLDVRLSQGRGPGLGQDLGSRQSRDLRGHVGVGERARGGL